MRVKYSRYDKRTDTYLPPKTREWGIDRDKGYRNKVIPAPSFYPQGNVPIAQTVQYEDVTPTSYFEDRNGQLLMFFEYIPPRYHLAWGEAETDRVYNYLSDPPESLLVPTPERGNPDNIVVVLTLFSGPRLMKWDGEKYREPQDNRTNIHISFMDQLLAHVRGEGEIIEYHPLPVWNFDNKWRIA